MHGARKCDTVNKQDNTRIDLIIADDQHLYLKACDYRERQKWLVALASQKATYPTMSMSTPASANPQAKAPSSDEAASTANTAASHNSAAIHVPNLGMCPFSFLSRVATDSSCFKPLAALPAPSEATNLLKIKKSELQLYCDLLTQQSHEMKNLVNAISSTHSGATAAESSASNASKSEDVHAKSTTSKPTETTPTENIKVSLRTKMA